MFGPMGLTTFAYIGHTLVYISVHGGRERERGREGERERGREGERGEREREREGERESHAAHVIAPC